MRAFFAEAYAIKRDEISARQSLAFVRAHAKHGKKLRLINVKKMLLSYVTCTGWGNGAAGVQLRNRRSACRLVAEPRAAKTTRRIRFRFAPYN